MIIAHIETGYVRLTAGGENAFIIRGNEKIKIPSAEIKDKIIKELENPSSKELEKFKKEYPKFMEFMGTARKKLSSQEFWEYEKGCPKLMENDTIVCGKKTVISIDISYNRGKENPVDDWKSRESKSVYMGPNSELQVSGIERWDKVDKSGKRHYGEFLKNIELKKGLFSVSYSNTEDILVTPVAFIKFISGGGGGLFDVYENILYSNASKSASSAGGVEYTNRLTKKSFIAKSDLPEEIIVTKDTIYRKGMLQMDDAFTSLSGIAINSVIQSKLYKVLPSIDEKTMAEQYKNMPKTMEQVVGGIDMLKQMSPDDLERLMKMGEAHGAKVSPEMMQQIKEIPEVFKALEKEGTFKEMKQAMAMGKGLLEGLGDKGIERFARAQTEGIEKAKKAMGQPVQAFTAEGKPIDIESLLESPRKYKPLTDAKKVA